MGKNETWTKAPPIDGTIVVNIGDLLQFWSAGKYRATPHRVTVDAETSNQSRFSVAMFIHPNHETAIRPYAKVATAAESNARPITTALEHVQKRFLETYSTT